MQIFMGSPITLRAVVEASGFLAAVHGAYKPDFSPTSAASRVAAAVIPPAEIVQPAIQVEQSECSCELRPITCPNFCSVFIEKVSTYS